MKSLIIKSVVTLLIGFGLYGVVAVPLFIKTQGLIGPYPNTDKKQYYERYLQPTIDKRLECLNMTALAEAERPYFQKVVMWMSDDYDANMNIALRGHIALLGLVVSLFSIVIGIQILLWHRQGNLRKQIKQLTQQSVPGSLPQGVGAPEP